MYYKLVLIIVSFIVTNLCAGDVKKVYQEEVQKPLQESVAAMLKDQFHNISEKMIQHDPQANAARMLYANVKNNLSEIQPLSIGDDRMKVIKADLWYKGQQLFNEREALKKRLNLWNWWHYPGIRKQIADLSNALHEVDNNLDYYTIMGELSPIFDQDVRKKRLNKLANRLEHIPEYVNGLLNAGSKQRPYPEYVKHELEVLNLWQKRIDYKEQSGRFPRLYKIYDRELKNYVINKEAELTEKLTNKYFGGVPESTLIRQELAKTRAWGRGQEL
jgi:hypothetical protein